MNKLLLTVGYDEHPVTVNIDDGSVTLLNQDITLTRNVMRSLFEGLLRVYGITAMRRYYLNSDVLDDKFIEMVADGTIDLGNALFEYSFTDSSAIDLLEPVPCDINIHTVQCDG